MTRTWTTVGAEYTDGARRTDVLAAIDSLTWVKARANMTLGFMQGAAIKTAIRELDLPDVTLIAHNGVVEWPPPNGDADGEAYAVYGIEANYRNGRARVYVLDTGTSLIPVASDFWPEEAA